MNSSVAIVILNFNGKHWLEQFLPSVIAHSESAEIIVADNASTDGSETWFKAHYPQLRWINNNSNLGYSGGYNTALSQIVADIFVLLNSDIEVSAGWLKPVVDFLTNHPQAAAAQPKILQFNQKTHFEYAGASGGFIDRLGFPFCRGRVFESYEEDLGQYDDIDEVFWASGACLFVKSSAFHEIGGLDDSFFAHMEEIDLCWRLKNLGYSIWVVPQSKVYHVGGGTLNKQNSRKTYLNFRNNIELIYKNIEQNFLVKTIFLRMILDGVAAFKFLFSNGYAHFFAIVRAHLHFYRMLPKIRKKRKILRSKISNRNTKGVYLGSIVYDYFIKNKKSFSDIVKH